MAILSSFRAFQASSVPTPVMWLDGGNAASASGSGATSWNNLVASPPDGAAQADYNGDRTPPYPEYNVAGGWNNVAGAGYFDITPNTTLIESLHKDAASYTLVFVYIISPTYPGADTQNLFGTLGTSGSKTGIRLAVSTARNFVIDVKNAGSSALSVTSSMTLSSAGDYQFLAVSVNEQTGSGLFLARRSGASGKTTETFNCAYSSPSSGSATHTANIMAAGGGEGIIPAHAVGTPHILLQSFLFNSALTESQLDSLFNIPQIKDRYSFV